MHRQTFIFKELNEYNDVISCIFSIKDVEILKLQEHSQCYFLGRITSAWWLWTLKNKPLCTANTYSVSHIVQKGQHYIYTQEELAQLKAACITGVCVAKNIP